MLRTLCAGGSAVAGVSIAGCSGNTSGNKASKADVNYQDHPKDGQQYSGCQYFVPPAEGGKAGTCSRVEGDI